MEPSKTVAIDADLWENTQQELSRLRQQNLVLASRIKSLQMQIKGPEFKNRYSMTQTHAETCSNGEASPQKNERVLFKSQMTQWLTTLNKKYKKSEEKEPQFRIKRTLSGIQQQKQQKISEADESKENSYLQTIKHTDRNGQDKKQIESHNIVGFNPQPFTIKLKQQIKEMKMIQSICLYGPGEKQILKNIGQRRIFINNSLLYSVSKQHEETFKIYGEYFYPEGLVGVKNMREEEAPTQINQIIFRKNTKKQDCSLFMFRGDDNNKILKQQNTILSKINPGKWLSAFFVQFSDFEALTLEQNMDGVEDKNNKSLIEYTPDQKLNKNLQGGESDRVKPSRKKTTHYVKGKYTLCIFTYFPIISVMEHLLSSILDEVKIKRVEKFATTNLMSDVSIKFLIDELSDIASSVYSQIEKIPCTFGELNKICFGNFEIHFDMAEGRFEQLVFKGWVHDVLKIFEKDLIYELFTNMMTQESICFVSENIHLLTYVIYFFVNVLAFPFAYPHPCISNVFNYELLESPFVVVAGINQSSKWLDENVSNYPKKIFVDLNDEVRIKGKKKPKTIKSQKLKKIFNSLYKKIESNNSPVPQIFKKKQNIIRPASKQQNYTAITFLKGLQTYYNEEIFVYLPNPAIIAHIRDKIDQTNETSKIYSILKQIQKYLKQSRKQKQKDQFIDMLIQQQIFYVFMGAKYQLD